jgi:hypothetical protein
VEPAWELSKVIEGRIRTVRRVKGVQALLIDTGYCDGCSLRLKRDQHSHPIQIILLRPQGDAAWP